MITFDGDRSKKRRWVAKKQVYLCEMLDVPSKAIMYEGFTCKGWKQDELTGGRVTAPMGAVVMCSSVSGIKVCISDYWMGAFTAVQDFYNLYTTIPDANILTTVLYKSTEEQLEGDDYHIVKFKPMHNYSAYGAPVYTTSSQDLLAPNVMLVTISNPALAPGFGALYYDFPSTPGISPYFAGEAYSTYINDLLFIDLNDNGSADLPVYSIERNLNYYISNGSNLAGRTGVTQQGSSNSDVARFIQQIDVYNYIAFECGYYRRNSVGEKIITTDTDYSPREVPEGEEPNLENSGPVVTETTLNDLIPVGSMPNDLRDLLLITPGGATTSGPLATYSFMNDDLKRVTFTAIDATDKYSFDPLVTVPPLSYWFANNPGNDDWRIFYIFKVGDAEPVLINGSSFYTLLRGLITPPAVDGWGNMARAIGQILTVPPTSHNHYTPHDSYLFSAHNGNLYSWTRFYGAFEISETGINHTGLSIPIEVTDEEGVAPEILYCGLETYLCVCVKRDIEIVDAGPPVVTGRFSHDVLAVYMGSPFSTWTNLASPTDNLTVVYVRPIQVTSEDVLLMGIGRLTIEATEETPEYEEYRMLFLSWQDDPEDPEEPTEESWIIMGKIPVDVTDFDSFSMSLFGSGYFVEAMANFKTNPVVQPQVAVGPYNLYNTAPTL